jgi:environmental stress-induced protein Ves
MSSLRLVMLADASPQPWRNGGGLTRELFTWPAAGPWQLRISVADITQDGPFSAFDGVDRWFAVVQGAGVRLWLPAGPVDLHADGAPLPFAGEAAPGCTLIGGATRDLNLMVKRAAGRGAMQRVQPGLAWTDAAPLRALFTAEPLSLMIDHQPAVAVPARTLAVGTQAAHQRWQVDGTGQVPQAWWLAFEPTAGHPGAAP